jgi:hypothetical protein
MLVQLSQSKDVVDFIAKCANIHHHIRAADSPEQSSRHDAALSSTDTCRVGQSCPMRYLVRHYEMKEPGLHKMEELRHHTLEHAGTTWNIAGVSEQVRD